MAIKDKIKNRTKTQSEESVLADADFEDKVFPDVFSPMGFLVLSWALFLDILGLVGLIPALGQVLSIIPDILGILTLGIYEWRQGGNLPLTKKFMRFFTKRGGARFFFELLPVVGILPIWTVYVYKKSRSSPGEVEVNEEIEEYAEAA
ncbi:MAG: hypothetical protein R3346_00965 [Candidatus Spechtbacterales bacterium]|nr:hypothetical protein [Candidatus Spechtbacterales bacterium]